MAITAEQKAYLDSLSDEEIQKHIQAKTAQPAGILPQVGGVLKSAALGAGRAWLGQNPESKDEIDLYRKKKEIEQQYEMNPIEKFKIEQQIKQDMENKDPYRQSQIDLNRKLVENISGGGQGDLIYRDPATGLEIPKEQALAEIASGKQYIINRKQVSKSGVTEQSVSKPEDLTESEKNYVTTSDRVLKSLDALQNTVYPKLDAMKSDKNWASFQAQKVPYALIGDQNIQDFKSALTQLKADIPFLRGGKQLTATEAKRVDILLDPFGKTEETRQKDVQRFKDEFLAGQRLVRGGTRELNRRVDETSKTQTNKPLYAVNPSTKERLVSNDGGTTWQPEQ